MVKNILKYPVDDVLYVKNLFGKGRNLWVIKRI